MKKRKIILIFTISIAIILLIIAVPIGKRIISVSNNSYTEETDTFLGYMLAKGDKSYIIRCEKDVKSRFADFTNNGKLTRTIISFNSSKDDFYLEEEEEVLAKIEEHYINKILANNELGIGGYVVGGGKEEIFLYTNDVVKIQKIFSELENEFPSHQLKLEVKEDKDWSYYNAYCEKRQFPAAS